jgi:hypothetical protein
VTKSRSNPFHTSGNSPTDENVSSPSSAPAPDFLVENHGSISLLRPVTDAGRDWVDQHIGADNGFQPYYPVVAIEHRYISDVVAGIRECGLVCQ